MQSDSSPSPSTLWHRAGRSLAALLLRPFRRKNETRLTLEKYARRLEIQHEIDRAILTTQSAEDIAEATLTQLQNLIPYQHASVVLFDYDTEEATVLAAAPQTSRLLTVGERRPLVEFQHLLDMKAGEHVQAGDLREASLTPIFQLMLKENVLSTFSVPLISPTGLIGSLSLYAAQPEAFVDEHIELTADIASQLTTAIQQAHLLRATRRQLKELLVLQAVAKAGAEMTGVEALVERVTEIIGDALYPDNFGIMLIDEANRSLQIPPSYQGRNGAGVYRSLPVGSGISGHVAATGQPLRVGDVSTCEHYIQANEETRSELCVPLKVGERTIGVINAESRQPDAFSKADERLVMTLAGQVATAIEKVRLFEQAQQEISERKRAEAAQRQAQNELEQRVKERTAELTLLNRASRAMVSTLDLAEVFVIVLEEARRLMDVVACSVWLEDGETGELVCRHNTGPLSDRVQGWRMPRGTGIVGWVTSHGQSVLVGDAQQDERHNPDIGEAIQLTTRSLLSVPLVVKGRTIGALQVLDTTPFRFDEHDLELMESLAAVAAGAVENARLYEQARQDAETKTILLKEVNHRVKNNLSVIIGLLYAGQRQGNPGDTGSYQSMMRDLINRVQGLATVHSMLSASEWMPLPLSMLASQVIRSALQALPLDKHVDINVTPSEVRVTPEQAHSLSLILSELVTNSVKYGLPALDNGRLTVQVSELEEGTVILRYSDNGPGYSEEMLQPDCSQRNVGFHLIENITRRSLNGSLTLSNDSPGAVTTVSFPAGSSQE